MACVKGPNKIEANNFAAGMIEWYGKRQQQKKWWADEKQSPLSSKAQSLGRASHKGKWNQKNSKKWKVDCASQSWQTHEQQADFGHTWKKGTRKAQISLDCTQPIQDTVWSWVRGKKAWFGSGERGKTYFEIPTWALLGEVSCQNDIPP